MNQIVTHSQIDEIEVLLMEYPPVNCPLTHEFVPGMYIRTIFMPRGTMITSLVHGVEHPYFIMEGLVAVLSETDGEQMLYTGQRGITKPGTRRLLFIHEDTTWITVHRTDIKPKEDTEESIKEAVQLIMDKIIMPYENQLIGGRIINNVLFKNIDNEA